MEPKIVVMGGSAGSLEVIQEIARMLPPDLSAAVVVVVHTLARQRSYLATLLSSQSKLPARLVSEGDRIKAGEIYVCPPDRHLVLAKDHFHLSRGPKEGLNRPSINATFRSAATSYGNRTIGVLLSGMLDDGAAGIWEISNRGGTTIVQDPDDATFPSMPLNALRDARVDYRVPSAEIGPLISKLASGDMKPERSELPQNDERVFSGFTCPECRGPLFQIKQKGPLEFKCRVGHAMSLAMLLDQEASTQERKLYEAIVALQDGAELADYAANRVEGANAEALRNEAGQLRRQAEALQKMIEERVVSSIGPCLAGSPPECRLRDIYSSEMGSPTLLVLARP